MDTVMRKVGTTISFMMSFTLSFFLSITGVVTGNMRNIREGNVSMPQLVLSIIVSYIMSTVISLMIGFIVPMGKVNEALAGNMKGIKRRLYEALISDLVYTPIITFAMTGYAYTKVMRESQGMAQIHFIPMFLSSLLICMAVGYVFIFILQPVFTKIAFKKHGVSFPPAK